MGALFYGNDIEPITIPDHALSHLKVLFASKLRRGESFSFTWKHTADQVRGRSTIWIHPAIPMRFVFEEEAAAPLDQELLQDFARRANSSTGLAIDFSEFDSSADIERRGDLRRVA
ncbi:hypothetical protein [Microbacterium sp. NPDC076911]|uniref:DUF7882 family protein n=1 Tax=Microbacterium sp. NPDC076911 TaxID=3154958 RepID=UPI003446463E